MQQKCLDAAGVAFCRFLCCSRVWPETQDSHATCRERVTRLQRWVFSQKAARDLLQEPLRWFGACPAVGCKSWNCLHGRETSKLPAGGLSTNTPSSRPCPLPVVPVRLLQTTCSCVSSQTRGSREGGRGRGWRAVSQERQARSHTWQSHSSSS